MKKLKRFSFICILVFCFVLILNTSTAYAKMPYYNLHPKKLCVRAEFETFYQSSSEERKHNIALAVKSIDKSIVDVGGEFSFNNATGKRTEKEGYKEAKIILNGKFTEGIGGGVCQVSTTLYNAVLLAGLKITEYHPHSLPVGYVEPSFDAMVNSSFADLRFVNCTKNPIVIRATADGSKLKIVVLGEPLNCSYIRESEIVDYLDIKEELIKDEKLEYPGLKAGERQIVSYGKRGYKSVGYLIKKVGKTVVYKKLIRKDKYNSTNKIIIEGTALLSQ